MYLLNITPSNAIVAKDKPRDSVLKFISNVTLFYETYMLKNNIEHFYISKINHINKSTKTIEIELGKNVFISDIEEIVRESINDNIKIICRGDGCRFFSFGYDYDSWLCVKHADVIPNNIEGITVSDISGDLIATDWYDE